MSRAEILAITARLREKRVEVQYEYQREIKFWADVMAVWTPELQKKYPTLRQLMESPEATELRKHYWRSEAERRGEL